MLIASWIVKSILIAFVVILMAFVFSCCRISSRVSRLEEAEANEIKQR